MDVRSFLKATSNTLHDLNLLVDVLHFLPVALEILLPQCHFIVTSAHGQDIAAQAPADAPQDGVEFEDGAGPLAGG